MLERVGKKRSRKARHPRHMLQEGNEMRTRFLACYYFRPSDNQHSHKRVWLWISKLSYVPKTWGYRNLICFPRRPCQVLAARFKNVKWCHRWVFLPSPTPLFSYFPHLPISFFFLWTTPCASQQYHVEFKIVLCPLDFLLEGTCLFQRQRGWEKTAGVWSALFVFCCDGDELFSFGHPSRMVGAGGALFWVHCSFIIIFLWVSLCWLIFYHMPL